MIEILRPARPYIVLIPLTTYSPATWTSPRALSGSVTAHQEIPRFVSAGSQFQEKLCCGLLPVPGTSRTGAGPLAGFPEQAREASSLSCGTESAGPGCSSGAYVTAPALAGASSATVAIAPISPLPASPLLTQATVPIRR